jgi:hypothetical protein
LESINFVSLARDTKFSLSSNSSKTSCGYFGGSSVAGRFDDFGILCIYDRRERQGKRTK